MCVCEKKESYILNLGALCFNGVPVGVNDGVPDGVPGIPLTVIFGIAPGFSSTGDDALDGSLERGLCLSFTDSFSALLGVEDLVFSSWFSLRFSFSGADERSFFESSQKSSMPFGMIQTFGKSSA